MMLTISLPLELEQELSVLAKETGQTASSYALRVLLDHLEDMEDARIADERLDAFYKSGAKAVPLEDVLKRYGVDA